MTAGSFLRVSVIVQKYGGTSVGEPEKIKRVARRVVETAAGGNEVCVVVSAMGHTTDELIELAKQVSPDPHPREMDMLLTAGERISMALLSMAINDLGREAVSFTGSQAGIVTDTTHGKARIVEIRAKRVQEALDGEDRDRRRLPGRLDHAGRDDARPRRLRYDRGGARRGARRGGLRDLHRRDGRLHRRPPDREERAQDQPGHLRGDARAGGVRGGRPGAAVGRVRSYPRRQDPRPLVLLAGRGDLDRQGGRHAGTGDRLGNCARHQRGEGDHPRRARPGRGWPHARSARSRTPGSTST